MACLCAIEFIIFSNNHSLMPLLPLIENNVFSPLLLLF